MELLAEFDWNQVLTQGLIGGVIGGLVGLVAYFFRKPPTDPPAGKPE